MVYMFRSNIGTHNFFLKVIIHLFICEVYNIGKFQTDCFVYKGVLATFVSEKWLLYNLIACILKMNAILSFFTKHIFLDILSCILQFV